MKREHTPGPWREMEERNDFGGKYTAIYGSTGCVLDERGFCEEEDLVLALSAPDLLAACEVTFANLELAETHPDTLPMRVLRAAIAKARGK